MPVTHSSRRLVTVLFHTSAFALFFFAVWSAHWALIKWPRVQLGLLLAASWFFYGYWDPRFLALLVGSSAIDYLCGLRVAASQNRSSARRWLTLSVVVNLSVLGVFKYLDFFAASFTDLLEAFGLVADPISIGLVLPVGISFYTFQTMSYTIDVYRGDGPAIRDPLAYATYVAFFPQLVAGPIERAHQVVPQLTKPRAWSTAGQVDGVTLFAIGLFEKVVVADNLAPLVELSFSRAPGASDAFDVAVGSFAFAFQIYGDFAGYSHMAIGLAACLGVRLSRNFSAPYLAQNPRDFWRRWHISLSSWLRDYLYRPLGGNRRGPVRTAINLALTMLLGGLWHGASWTFVVWGAFHGLWLAVHRGLAGRLWPGASSLVGSTLAVLFSFQLTCLGWLIFRAPDLGTLVDLLGALGRPSLVAEDGLVIAHVLRFTWVVIGLQALERACPGLWSSPRFRSVRLVLAGYAILHVLTEGVFEHGRQFIYFQF